MNKQEIKNEEFYTNEEFYEIVKDMNKTIVKGKYKTGEEVLENLIVTPKQFEMMKKYERNVHRAISKEMNKKKPNNKKRTRFWD